MDVEDLLFASYIPNNPSLVLDTSLWKTGEDQNQSSPLIQLQPILVNQSASSQHDQESAFYLTQEEGMVSVLKIMIKKRAELV